MRPDREHTRFVRTILEDISPTTMGVTYSHEHIIIDDCYATREDPAILLNDVPKIIQELTDFYSLGGRTVVDAMPAGCGRNIRKLEKIAQDTQVHIIASTGLHLEKYYPPDHWRYQCTEDELTRMFIADVEVGIDTNDYNGPEVVRSFCKAGVIKLATGDEKITAHQEKIFRAVSNTHRETGVPILTHTNAGKNALDQVNLLASLGADLQHVVISHTDRFEDVTYNRELLRTGVKLEFDSAFRWKDKPNWTFRLLESLLEEYPDQITMGMDAAKSVYWKSYGGSPGLNYLLVNFPQELRRMNLFPYFHNIFIKTPATLFSFT